MQQFSAAVLCPHHSRLMQQFHFDEEVEADARRWDEELADMGADANVSHCLDADHEDACCYLEVGLEELKSWLYFDANGNWGGVHLANLLRMLEDAKNLTDVAAMIAVDKTHASANSLADSMADVMADA